MKKKSVSLVLFFLAASLVFPLGTQSFAATLPVASNDSYKTNENSMLDIASPGILSNDTSADGKTLSAGLVTDVKNGILILNSNGSFVYVPDIDFHGIDGFRYVAHDGVLSSNIVNVTIAVNTINHPPIARNDSFSVNENATLSVSGNGVLANDIDPDGNALTASLVTSTLNGVLALNHNGSFTYSPYPNFHGVDSFTYIANDGISSSNVATVSIAVNGIITPNPLLQIIEQIQNLFSKITNIEQEIISLQDKNNALEARVAQLENLIHNGTQIINGTGITGNGEHDEENKSDNGHDNHGKHNKRNNNKDD